MRRTLAAAVVVCVLLSGGAHASCVPSPPGMVEAARGHLVNTDGKPVVSAHLTFYHAVQRGQKVTGWRKSKRLLSALTDSDGAFDFTQLPPGTFFLEVKSASVERTLLLTITGKTQDPRREIRMRLLGVECNGFEVIPTN
ncbi:MAG: carboxypeptidase-like regulatory domain-containing protein [Terriglobales bacterium]